MCENGAGLFHKRDMFLRVAPHPPCDHWKLQLASTSLANSWAQSSTRRLVVSMVRWNEPAIMDNPPRPPGIHSVRYTLADTNGTLVELDEATHDGKPPERLALFGLHLMHAHTYFVYVTPKVHCLCAFLGCLLAYYISLALTRFTCILRARACVCVCVCVAEPGGLGGQLLVAPPRKHAFELQDANDVH